MKKIFICILSILLFMSKAFSDCYFSVDGPSVVSLQDWPSGNAGSALFSSGIVGLSCPFFIKDNFSEFKTTYLLELFTESQFTVRWGKKVPSENGIVHKNDVIADNDFYISAGVSILQILRPKLSYGFLTKDIYASAFIGIPLPFLGSKFLDNKSTCGFQACFGFEPIYNITNKESLDKPFYFNYRANFKINLDFSRRNRYAKYIDNQRRIQAEKEEYERKLREQQAEQERIEKERQRKEDEKTAKQLGFSSVEDYYADLNEKEHVKKRLSFNNFYNQVLYENGIPLEIGDIFTIPSGNIKVVDRIVENNGYTYLVTFVSSAAENSIDYARTFGAYGGGFRHCFYITTKKALNLRDTASLTTYERYVTNRYELKLMCAGKSQYQRNYQDVDCYIFVGSE